MSKAVVMASWDDVPHLTEQQKADLLDEIPLYQRDARTKGVPQLGSGAIYPISEDDIKIKPFDLPKYWPRAYGLDVGWKKTAALWGAHDRESDVWYLYSEYYRGQAEPSVHAESIKSRGEWMQGAIDPAAHGRGQKDGEKLMESYLELGLNVQNAVNAVEAGLFEVYRRMSTGRLKIFSNLMEFWGEIRLYRRDEKGAVVKLADHLMDAMRYLIMTAEKIEMVMPHYLEAMGKETRRGSVVSDYDPLNPPDGQSIIILPPGVSRGQADMPTSYDVMLGNRR